MGQGYCAFCRNGIYFMNIKEEYDMPKMKTKRAAAQRYKVTGTGKVMRMQANKSHILNKKTRKRKRNLRKQSELDQTNLNTVRKLIPYAK